MEEKDLTREQRLEIEEKAIEALLQMGVRFSVPLKVHSRRTRSRKWFLKRFALGGAKPPIPKGWDVGVMEVPDIDTGDVKSVPVRNFHIKPLYLGTIDYLRKLYIQIEYDEERIQDMPIQESQRLFRYIPLMAEIAAVAIINDRSAISTQSKQVQELKEFLLDHLTVTRLQKLSNIIAQMMNPGGFTSSIRLIREVGVTKPKADLVE